MMNFSPKIILYVQVLIKDANTKVQLNGVFSPDFLIMRSVRHGCPLAPLLFAIAMELLIKSVLNLHKNKILEGIQIVK